MTRFALTALLAFFAPKAKAKDRFFLQELEAISLNESDGGKNLNHQEITKGPYKGMRAGGAYGILPSTARELVINNEVLFVKYYRIVNMTHYEITELLNSDHKMSQDIALVFWKKLRVNLKFGPSRAAYAWLYGPGAALKVSEQAVHENNYVKKFTGWLYWKKQDAQAQSKKP